MASIASLPEEMLTAILDEATCSRYAKQCELERAGADANEM